MDVAGIVFSGYVSCVMSWISTLALCSIVLLLYCVHGLCYYYEPGLVFELQSYHQIIIASEFNYKA